MTTLEQLAEAVASGKSKDAKALVQRALDEAMRANAAAPVKIMVGGAPISQQFCDEVGADGFAPDAGSAVDKARALMGG